MLSPFIPLAKVIRATTANGIRRPVLHRRNSAPASTTITLKQSNPCPNSIHPISPQMEISSIKSSQRNSDNASAVHPNLNLSVVNVETRIAISIIANPITHTICPVAVIEEQCLV
jgi:hypothetical protein